MLYCKTLFAAIEVWFGLGTGVVVWVSLRDGSAV